MFALKCAEHYMKPKGLKAQDDRTYQVHKEVCYKFVRFCGPLWRDYRGFRLKWFCICNEMQWFSFSL